MIDYSKQKQKPQLVAASQDSTGNASAGQRGNHPTPEPTQSFHHFKPTANMPSLEPVKVEAPLRVRALAPNAVLVFIYCNCN